MRKIFLMFITLILMACMVGCSSRINVSTNTDNQIEDTERETVETISFSGTIEKIIVFDSYKEITINSKNGAKTFWLRNSTHLFDNSYNPKVEPYLEIGTYVDIEVEKEEYNKNKPVIKKITITSYDGIFQV